MRKIYRVTQYDPANIFILPNKCIADANAGKITLTLADIKGYLVLASNEYPLTYKGLAVFYDETKLHVIDTINGNRLMYEVESFEVVGMVEVDTAEAEAELQQDGHELS